MRRAVKRRSRQSCALKNRWWRKGRRQRSAGPGNPPAGLVPRRPHVVIDRDAVLAAAGLLAADHPGAAYALLGSLIDPSV